MTTTKNFLKSDSLILVLLLIPILYLFWMWPNLPDRVPLHWNFRGEVDRYGSKQSLIWIVVGLNLFIYLLMLLLPKIAARKQQLEAMGNKYNRLRLVLQLFMASISVVIVLMAEETNNWNRDFLLGGCFILFMVLFGNYVGSIRPNYFLGVRTPWTLQSDKVWRKTHHLTGRLLMAGALLGVILLLALPQSWGVMSVAIIMTAAFLIPAVCSFFWFQQEQTT